VHSRIARFHQTLHNTGRVRNLAPEFTSYQYEPLREAAMVAGELKRRGVYGRGARG
jgi:mitochondrial fission protein ELM1